MENKDDTPIEVLEAQKLLSARFPNYLIIAIDCDKTRFEKFSDEHWVEGICRHTAIEICKQWEEAEDDDEVDY